MTDTRPLSPCVDQSESDIEAYYRIAEVGQKAVVRHTQGHMLQYVLSEIEGRNPQRGRIYIRNSGAFYMRSGKNCFHPKGQTTLVVPTDEVLAWASVHPRGEFGYSIYRHSPWLQH